MDMATALLRKRVMEVATGNEPPRLTTLGCFLDANEFDDRERHEIIDAVLSHRPYQGGGGAVPEWTLSRLEGPAAQRWGLIG